MRLCREAGGSQCSPAGLYDSTFPSRIRQTESPVMPDLPWREMSISQKLIFLMNNITVEPILTCYILPNVLANLATQNMNLEKACRVNLAYPVEVCDAIKRRETANLTEQEEEVQKLVVGMTYWQSILRSALPAVLILFLGSFSDRSGRRKPFMLLPISGELFTTIGLLLCTYFYYEWPMEVAGVVEAIFPALTGGWTTMFMGAFSYMGDITSVSERTVRLGIVNVFVSIAVPVGTMGSGFLYQAIGFYGVFTTVAIMYAFALVYGALRLKEAREPKKLPDNLIKEILNPKHVLETFRVALKSRKGNLRLRIILVMVLSITIFGPIHGEIAVGYLFGRYRFNWDEVDFSIYSTYSMIVTLLGTSLAIGVFTHLLKMEDSMLGVIACISKIVASLFYAFAKTTYVFYLATLIDLVGGTALIAMRSIASKLVPSEELGKINSLFGVCEAIVPVIYQPLYSYVYNKTLKTLPGAFFLVGASLMIPTTIIFGYLNYLQKKDPIGNTDDGGERIEKPNGIKNNDGFDMSDEQPNSIDTKL